MKEFRRWLLRLVNPKYYLLGLCPHCQNTLAITQSMSGSKIEKYDRYEGSQISAVVFDETR